MIAVWSSGGVERRDRHTIHVPGALPILHVPSRSLILSVIGELDA
jgi:hypothetical protein